MKIGLFGGSFNPIHIGHINIAREAIKSLKLDKLIFIPCQINPFKKDHQYVKAEHRINMINLVLEDKMEISNFETNRQGISYTIDTIQYFKNKYPNDELFLIIGSDNLSKLSKWKKIDEIAQLAKISIFKRNQVINKTNIKKYQAILINNKIYPQSSSRFINGCFDDLDQKVLHYIGHHQIYFEQILQATLTQKRYLHSLHARDFALKLAQAHHFDIKKAAFTALVHDIAKHLANDHREEARKMIKKYEPQNAEIEDYRLHQELGYIILKHIFDVEDDIAHAVRYHTSLTEQLSLLDKIVYLADKLCQGRKYPGIQKIRELALKNIDLALSEVIKQSITFNKAKGIEFSKEQQKIYDKWII